MKTVSNGITIVPLPKGAHSVEITISVTDWQDRLYYETGPKGEYATGNGIELPPGEWELVGLVTNGEKVVMDFDPGPYVEFFDDGQWRNYTQEDQSFYSGAKQSANESFLSLLESEGFLSKNRLGERPQEPYYPSQYAAHVSSSGMGEIDRKYKMELKRWQSEEQKVFHVIAVLKKK